MCFYDVCVCMCIEENLHCEPVEQILERIKIFSQSVHTLRSVELEVNPFLPFFKSASFGTYYKVQYLDIEV